MMINYEAWSALLWPSIVPRGRKEGRRFPLRNGQGPRHTKRASYPLVQRGCEETSSGVVRGPGNRNYRMHTLHREIVYTLKALLEAFVVFSVTVILQFSAQNVCALNMYMHFLNINRQTFRVPERLNGKWPRPGIVSTCEAAIFGSSFFVPCFGRPHKAKSTVTTCDG